jgi:hypothetical protein
MHKHKCFNSHFMSTERIGQPTQHRAKQSDLLSNVDNKVQVDVSTCNTFNPIHQSNIDKYRSEVAQRS